MFWFTAFDRKWFDIGFHCAEHPAQELSVVDAFTTTILAVKDKVKADVAGMKQYGQGLEQYGDLLKI